VPASLKHTPSSVEGKKETLIFWHVVSVYL
jgi:hypothetical protein